MANDPIRELRMSPQTFRFQPVTDADWADLQKRRQLPDHLLHCMTDRVVNGATEVLYPASVHVGEAMVSLSEALLALAGAFTGDPGGHPRPASFDGAAFNSNADSDR